MKNTLKIKNFLIIDSAKVEIKKFTVFIGPQASGKSIVAKLIYLFYHLPEFVFEVANSGGKKRKLNELVINTFCEIFPKYAWNDKDFKIILTTDVGEISFSHTAKKILMLQFSPDYEKILRKIFLFSEKEQVQDIPVKKRFEHFQKLSEIIYNLNWGFINCAGSSVFIPAGRSFFSCLENNVFSFLSNNIHIDYFLKEFGMIFQNSKFLLSRVLTPMEKKTNLFADVCKKYIGGTYFQRQQKDYIRNLKGNLEIELRDASSGQQELLPILFVIFRESEGIFLVLREFLWVTVTQHCLSRTFYNLLHISQNVKHSNT